jgi:peptidoglycan/LPS O-acetylase OafA/YrhL
VSFGAGEPTRSKYRPALDGLRTVAVYLVLAFHAGWGLFANGFIGVDVFFVLSGFLITGLLVREYRGTGRIQLARFYARRIRRLFPASAVVLTAGLVATLIVTGPLYQDVVVDDARASMLWVANWHFINVGNDYFSPEHTSPFIHFWSLAVEEQFYLVWPPLIGVLAFALRKRPRREGLLILVCGFLLLISLTLAFLVAAGDPLRAYYGTETRAYQLLAGALLALLINADSRHYRRRFWVWAQWTALVLIVFLAVGPSSIDLTMRGALVAAATVLIISALEFLPSGPLAMLLSRRPIVYLGQISYGTYLWHMPVLYILIETLDPGPIVLTFATAFIATSLAAVSAKYVEVPIRASRFLDERPRAVIVVGIGMSIVIAFTLLPRLAEVGNVNKLDATPIAADEVQPTRTLAEVDWIAVRMDSGDAPVCGERSASDCTVVDNGPDAIRVNVAGDSHAITMIPALAEIARDEGWTLTATVMGGCPWQWGVLYPLKVERLAEECRDFQNDWYGRLIPEIKPDVTIMMSLAFSDPTAETMPRAAEENQKGWSKAALISNSSKRAVEAVRKTGSQVILIDPVPIAKKSFNPLECLSEGGTVSACAFTSQPREQLVLEAQHELAGSFDNVFQVNLNRTVCPKLPLCEPFIDGYVVRRDRSHVTATFWIARKGQILDALNDVSSDLANATK